jgi:hypothetical protein
MSRVVHTACWVMLTCVVAVGCGKGGPRRYDLSGTVTFQGAPLPAGTISFDGEGNSMGGGYASIDNGRFDTAQTGRGHFGGVHEVTIVGTDGKRVNPDDPDSGMRSLFPPHVMKADLPKRSGTMDFEVPSSPP